MLKKVLYVGAAAVLLLGLFFGSDAVSYVSTSWNNVKESVRDRIPVTLEIQRANDMITHLDTPIEQNMKLIAEEEVEVEKLSQQVRTKKAELAK